jgi:hypothetical protein
MAVCAALAVITQFPAPVNVIAPVEELTVQVVAVKLVTEKVIGTLPRSVGVDPAGSEYGEAVALSAVTAGVHATPCAESPITKVWT